MNEKIATSLAEEVASNIEKIMKPLKYPVALPNVVACAIIVAATEVAIYEHGALSS